MQAHKVIFKGRLDFGSTDAVGRIIRQLESRFVTLYKEDLPWKPENLVHPDLSHMRIQPVSLSLTERTWKHGIDVMQWLAQFAFCGEVLAIRLSPERTYHRIAPDGQKAAVLLFRHAQESDAPHDRIRLLDQAIEKYDRHTEALMSRADLAMDREDFSAAAADLRVVASCDPENPRLWLCQARHDYRTGEWDQALQCTHRAISLSMPLEEIHWEGRLMKSRIHRSMGDMAEASREWTLLENRLEKTPEFLPGVLEQVRTLRHQLLTEPVPPTQNTDVPEIPSRREKVHA
ncbi:MAG: hypothetical protein J5I41_11755 [Saprospiraceae bacterium]|nr:hypothetical protein [Saprospiraceae bacterium]